MQIFLNKFTLNIPTVKNNNLNKADITDSRAKTYYKPDTKCIRANFLPFLGTAVYKKDSDINTYKDNMSEFERGLCKEELWQEVKIYKRNSKFYKEKEEIGKLERKIAEIKRDLQHLSYNPECAQERQNVAIEMHKTRIKLKKQLKALKDKFYETENAEERAHSAQAARNKITTANLRLVISIAKNYRNRGLSFSDLIQEGNDGLMRGVQGYEPKQGKFSTYAIPWIKQRIRKAIKEQTHNIKRPDYTYRYQNMLKEAERALLVRLHRSPDEDELVREMKDLIEKRRRNGIVKSLTKKLKLDPSEDAVQKQYDLQIAKLRKKKRYVKKLEKELKRVLTDDEILIAEARHLLKIAKDCLIQETPLERPNNDGEGDYTDCPVPNPDDPLENIILKIDKTQLPEKLEKLDDREKEVIRMRFLEEPTLTLKEIGEHLGITRERVRQIETEALTKLAESFGVTHTSHKKRKQAKKEEVCV